MCALHGPDVYVRVVLRAWLFGACCGLPNEDHTESQQDRDNETTSKVLLGVLAFDIIMCDVCQERLNRFIREDRGVVRCAFVPLVTFSFRSPLHVSKVSGSQATRRVCNVNITVFQHPSG